MRLVWEPEALDELAEAAGRSQRRAEAVVRRVETMAAVGFSLGRQTLDPSVRYMPVGRLGVFYRVRGGELRPRERLAAAGYQPAVVCGDGLGGHPANAPYGRVISTCQVRRVPPAWVRTLPG